MMWSAWAPSRVESSRPAHSDRLIRPMSNSESDQSASSTPDGDRTVSGAPLDANKALNLPRTDFPMKADLPRREPAIQQYWQDIQLYKRSLDKHAPRGSFVLHDGPPYSNGNIHIGTALQNKVPKDVTTRYRTLRGYCAPFIPGWDNHGMPIENAVSQEFRKKKIEPSRLDLRRACREYAHKWVNIQREQFKRLGIRGDWESPYLTMDPAYEARLVEVFGELAAKGFVYRGLRPIHWCPNCRTAVAGAEIEYDEEHVSTSIYVRFPANSDADMVFESNLLDRCFTIIWTTTPWTIPANVAVAVAPEANYVVVEAGGDRYLLAESLAPQTLVTCGLAPPPEGRTMESLSLADLPVSILKRLPGKKLTGLRFHHPLMKRESVLVLGEHVTMDVGTGVVHTAPGHGVDDFVIGQKYHLPALCPVDERGVFTADAGRFAGTHIEPGNRAVVDALLGADALLHEEPYVHSYPICWRCKGAVIFRATVQWFMNMEHHSHREKCLDAIDHLVKWHPSDAADRIRAYVSGRPDWCLSRQRAWGVGIPVIYCEECHNPVINEDTVYRIADAIRQTSSDAWYERDVADFMPTGFVCPQCGGKAFRKETDTLSVWFDSGSSCRTVLEQRKLLPYPADLYMEGYDQLRAWFNESLMIGMATKGRPPYREVVTHGFTVDDKGRKMSKSLGNVIDPMKLMETHGADILRWMAMSFDYWDDMRIGPEQLKQYAEQYRDIRNRFKFILSNLFDFNPAIHRVTYASMGSIDRWALHRLQGVIERTERSYDTYVYHNVSREVYSFLSSDLSAFYLDVVKDRLYTSLPDAPARRSAQTALCELARCLSIILSPILVHTMEEVWSHLPGARDEICSVHLCEFPPVRTALLDEALSHRWDSLFLVRREVQRVLDAVRREGNIRNTREAALQIRCPSSLVQDVEGLGEDLAQLFIVSKVEMVSDDSAPGVRITVLPAEGTKCSRCWMVLPSVGEDGEFPTLCARCGSVVRQWPIT